MDAFLFFICYIFLLGAQKLTLDLQLECHSRAYHLNIINLCPPYKQRMGWEVACAHAHERYAVTRVQVRAKWTLKHVCEVRARGPFFIGHTHTRATTHFAHFSRKTDVYS